LLFVYVGLGLEEEQSSPLISLPIAEVVLNVITAIFVTEFVVRIYGAESRWRYLRRHWIDILAVLPSLRWLRLLGLARLAVLLRLLRFVRLGLIARSLIDANRAAGRLQWIGKRNGVQTLLLTAFGFVWIGAGLTYEFEHGVNPDFANFGDSVWWAFTTMATLGHGAGPATVPGRVVAAFLMVLGIACFGLVTATVTTFVMQRTEGVQEYSSDDLMEAMTRRRRGCPGSRMNSCEGALTDFGLGPVQGLLIPTVRGARPLAASRMAEHAVNTLLNVAIR
jgi:voltage-gated potassium channel